MDIPLPLLDNEIQRAASLARRAREDLFRRGPDAAPRGSPLEDERRVSSRSTYLELGEMKDDPLIAPLRSWVFALTLERVLWPSFVRLASALHEASVQLEEPERALLSPRVLRARVLADPMKARRRAWASGLERGSRSASDAARILEERRAEATRRMGVDDADTIELPCNPTSSAASIADRWLDASSVMADLREDEPWDEAIARGMARGATSGWPAKLGSRWIEEQLRSTRLTDGLSIDLGELPEPLGAISFARTLARFGRSFAEASAPPSAPFVLARPPFDLRAERRAALFGGLLADPVFGVRALGLGRDRAKAQAREIALASLRWLRIEAARVRLRGALLLPEKVRKGRFEEETARALGPPIPAPLAGVVPLLAPGDAARFLGAVLAASDRRSLIDRFDEDWFRSPRAAEAIRGEQSVVPSEAKVSGEDLSAGLRELVSTFEGWLS